MKPNTGAAAAADGIVVRKAIKTRRHPSKRWLLALIVAGAAIIGFWNSIQRELTMAFLLRVEAPAQSVVDASADEETDPTHFLRRLWDTEKLPHRLRAISALERQLRIRSLPPPLYEALLLEAARDPDLEVRKLGLEMLVAQHHPLAAQCAARQLQDQDPAARVLGIQSLGNIRNTGWIPEVVQFAHDYDPRVVVSTGVVLQRWTRQDFGFRLHLALPIFDHPETNAYSDEQLENLNRAVNEFDMWWKAHSKDHPALFSPAVEGLERPRELPAPGCKLVDLNGSTVRLSDFRGKALILHCWDTANPSALDSWPVLAELQHGYTQDLVVLAVSLDTTMQDRSHEHEHQHHSEHAAETRAEDSGMVIRHALEGRPVSYPVLVDATGEVAHRFDVQTLPTFILVDRDGDIRRKFAGHRAWPAWSVMAEALVPDCGQHE